MSQWYYLDLEVRLNTETGLVEATDKGLLKAKTTGKTAGEALRAMADVVDSVAVSVRSPDETGATED